MRTGSDHVAIGQEAAVRNAEDLKQRALLDESVLFEPRKKMLRQRVIAPRGGPAEMVERQIEPPVDVGLRRVLSRAVGGDVDIGLGCGELRRRAVLVGGADVERVRAGLATEAGMDVGRQQRARKVAEMLDAVDVRQGTGDEISGHDALRSMMSADPESKNPPQEGRVLGPLHPNGARAPSIPPASLLRDGHSHLEAGGGEGHDAIPTLSATSLSSRPATNKGADISEGDGSSRPAIMIRSISKARVPRWIGVRPGRQA